MASNLPKKENHSPKTADKPSRKRGCCGCLFGIFLVPVILLLILALWADQSFSGRSNLIFIEFRNTTDPVLVQDAGGKWKPLKEFSPQSMEETLKKGNLTAGEGMTWRTLTVKRAAHNARERILNRLVRCQVHVIKFDPAQFSFFPWFEMDNKTFRPQTFRNALKSKDSGDSTRFAINLNYYGPDGQPLGWIVRDGQTIRKQWDAWSGFFFVKGGRTQFGPRSLLEETEGELTQATQGYPSVMKGGTVWKYVSTNNDQFFNGSELNYRSLAGVDADGKIVLVLSGQGGILNMGEVTELARLIGVKNATLLDGGRSLQFGITGGPEGTHSFHSSNISVKKFPISLPKRLRAEQPPVYLMVKRKKQ